MFKCNEYRHVGVCAHTFCFPLPRLVCVSFSLELLNMKDEIVGVSWNC